MSRPAGAPAGATRVCALLVSLLLLAPAGCDWINPENQPDQVLRDSLGLGDGDAVWRIELGVGEEREQVEPREVEVPEGAWVEFRTTDRRVHTVRFELDSLGSEAAAFLTSSGQTASPPLIELDSRYVVSFADAPVGRYPFVVEGNAASTRGAVVVTVEE